MIILASASPRRREILSLLDITFDVIPAKHEIEIDTSVSPEKAVELVAYSKAREVFDVHKNDTVIGADTSVYIDGVFLGKPASKDEACAMLGKLSGKTHKVITGVSIISPEKEISFADTAEVEFFPLDENDIMTYVASGEPMDKAGAYGIQGKGAKFIKRINGDFYTVMGLPCGRLYRELKRFI